MDRLVLVLQLDQLTLSIVLVLDAVVNPIGTVSREGCRVVTIGVYCGAQQVGPGDVAVGQRCAIDITCYLVAACSRVAIYSDLRSAGKAGRAAGVISCIAAR